MKKLIILLSLLCLLFIGAGWGHDKWGSKNWSDDEFGSGRWGTGGDVIIPPGTEIAVWKGDVNALFVNDANASFEDHIQ